MMTSRVRSPSVGEDDADKGRRGDAKSLQADSLSQSQATTERNTPTSRRHWGWHLLLSCAFVGGAIASSTVSSNAQIVPDATLGRESSQVKSPIPGSFQIDGGATRGTNLFHSFRYFSVPTGGSAYFNNAAPIQNIFTRVTGSSISNIDGLMRANGKANLFFLNPNGIIFGPHAQLDIGGSFVASTASRLKFANGSEFSAINPQAPPLLTVNLTPGMQWGASTPGATINNTGNLAVGQDLALIADKLDLQGQLQAGRDLTLLAQDTVRVRDTVATPFLAQAGGNLTIQGNQGIDILALNHPTQTPFVSGGNLSLISDGIISLDAHFASGGSFSIKSVSGGLANFVSKYDPIISSTGDVDVAADYEGASLLVESKGNIRFQGSINITGPDTSGLPTGPDTATLSTSSALILRSGQSALAYGGVNSGAVPASGNGIVPAGIRLFGDVTLQPFNGAGGIVKLTALLGNVSTQGITTDTTNRGAGSAIVINSAGSIITNGQLLDATNGEYNGGDIILSANGSITTGNLNSYSRSKSNNAGDGGAITLSTSNGDITTGNLNSYSRSKSDNAGNGGAITLITSNGNINTGEFDSYSHSKSGIAGNGGAITLSTSNGNITTRFLGSYSRSKSGNTGNGGAITLSTTKGNIITDNLNSDSSSKSGSAENGGAITLSTSNGSITITKNNGLDSYSHSNSGNAGNGGAIRLSATNGDITTGEFDSDSSSKSGSAGNGGVISLSATNGSITSGELQSSSSSGGSSNAGNGGVISLSATNGSITITKNNGLDSYSHSNSGNAGDAGAITLNTTNGNVTTNGNLNSYSSSKSGNAGNGGSIRLNTINGSITTRELDSDSSSGLGNAGNGGAISLSAANGSITTDYLNTSTSSGSGGGGNGGAISLMAANGSISTGDLVSESASASFAKEGNGGEISLSASNTIKTGSIISTGELGSGNITIYSQMAFALDNKVITSDAFGSVKGGDIQITAPSISLINGAQISASSHSLEPHAGQGGNITLTFSDFIELSGAATKAPGSMFELSVPAIAPPGRYTGGFIPISPPEQFSDGTLFPSGVFTQTITGSNGNAGNLKIETGRLLIKDKAAIATTTFGSGNAGNISIQAKDSLSVANGSILSGVAGEASGNSGTIELTTRSLSVTGGGTVQTQTLGEGKAGSIHVNGTDAVSLSGAGSGLRSGSGGSNNLLGTTSLNMIGQSGDITITTGNLSIASGAVLDAQSNSRNGGNINLQVRDLLLLRHNSLISASAGTANAGGDGGNITISAPFIIAVPKENSDIRANAYKGKGGNIQITTQGLFGIQFRPHDTPLSDITASSQFGVNGAVTINTPGIDPSRGLASLPINLVDASRRIVQNCGAGAASQRNSFVITGRGGLPVNPREALSRDAVHVDWVALNPKAENLASSAIAVPEKSATPAPLVEAQGWVINNQGQVVLVAQSPTLTPHSSWHKPSDCGVQKSVSSF